MSPEPSKQRGWFYGALGIIAIFTAILVIRWRFLPLFIDIYYHASYMAGFNDAGGITLRDFWEYAPVGRPHLYPPAFHIILLALKKAGLPVLFTIRLVSAAIYPLLLLSILWVVARLYDSRRAFFTVLAASLPYTFFLNTLSTIPSALALILFVFLFYAVETKRTFCGALLLGLSFYMHGGIPWLAVAALIIYAVLRREYLKSIFAIIAGGIALGSPWLIYVLGKRDYFFAVDMHINRYFEANIVLYLFAAVGVWSTLKNRRRDLFYLAMLVGMLPMAKSYAFRFFCGEGLLPVIFLAGIGFDMAYGKTAEFLKGKTRPAVYALLIPWAIFYLVTLCSPIVYKEGKNLAYKNQGASFLKFSAYDPAQYTALESSIYLPKYMDELSGIIKANTRSDDIIYCNYSYVAGIFYIFTDRASSTGMLSEVRPEYYSDPAALSALIVWVKNPEGVFDPALKVLADRLGLVKVAETDMAYVYRNPVVMAHKVVARPVISSGAAMAVLFIWLGAIFVCITKRNRI